MKYKSLIDLLSNFFKLTADELGDDTKIADIPGWNSLKHMNLIITLETEYSLQFEMEEIASMESIGSIRKILIDRGVTV